MKKSALEQGSVFFFPNFIFNNGKQSDKLIILLTKLSEINSLLVFCKTTSKQRYRNRNYGCNKEKSYFFVPQNQDLFHEDTWLILAQLRAYNPADIIKYHFDQKLIPIGKLKENTMRALLNCIRKIQDIDERYLDNIL